MVGIDQIWQLLVIFDTLLVLFFSYYALRFIQTNRQVLAMAGNWGRHIGELGTDSKRETARKEKMPALKGKLSQAIIAEYPLAKGVINRLQSDMGVSDNDLFSLITDREVLKGVGVIFDMFKMGGKAVDKLTGDKKPRRKKMVNPTADKVPLRT